MRQSSKTHAHTQTRVRTQTRTHTDTPCRLYIQPCVWHIISCPQSQCCTMHDPALKPFQQGHPGHAAAQHTQSARCDSSKHGIANPHTCSYTAATRPCPAPHTVAIIPPAGKHQDPYCTQQLPTPLQAEQCNRRGGVMTGTRAAITMNTGCKRLCADGSWFISRNHA